MSSSDFLVIYVSGEDPHRQIVLQINLKIFSMTTCSSSNIPIVNFLPYVAVCISMLFLSGISSNLCLLNVICVWSITCWPRLA